MVDLSTQATDREVPAFVGEARRATVIDLTERFDRCVEAGEAQLVVLEAAAGWGKTRIVHELYRHLQRDRQPEPPYWPPAIVPAGRELMRERKQVYPVAPTPPPGAAMPWLWWGLRCEEDGSGRTVRAIQNDREQLSAHLLGLVEAADRRAADRDLALDALGSVLELIPGIGQVVGATKALTKLAPRLHARITGARRPSGGEAEDGPPVVDTEGRDPRAAIGAELELVERFVSAELPLVLVIDDAQHADPLTAVFVREVLSSHRPVLVVATAWPANLADQAASEASLPADKRRSFGGILDAARAAWPDRVTEHHLEPLDRDALSLLVAQQLPEADEAQARVLVEVCGGNPLVLRLQLDSGRVRRAVRDGRLRLQPEDLRHLPRGFEDLVAERFLELDGDTRSWLAEAAVQGEMFFPGLLATPWGSVDPRRAEGFARPTGPGATSAWRFIERPIHTALRSLVEDEFTADEVEAWTAHTARAVLDWWRAPDRGDAWGGANDLPDNAEEALTWCRLGDRWTSRAVAEVDDDIAGRPTILASTLAGLNYSWRLRWEGEHEEELAAARRAAAAAERLQPADHELRLRCQVRVVGALRAVNDTAAAITVARMTRTALDELRSGGAVTADLASLVHGTLAQALLQGDQDLAEAEAEADAAYEVATTAADAHDQVWSLRIRASVQSERSDTAGATASLQAALDIAREVWPDDHARLVDLQTDLLDLADTYSAEAWQEMLEQALDDLGGHHWLVQYCRAGLCHALMVGSRFDETREQLSILANEGYPEEQLKLLRGMLSLYEAGDASAACLVSHDLAHGAYVNHRDRRMARDLEALIGQGGNDASWVGGWLEQFAEDPLNARRRLEERLADPPTDPEGRLTLWTLIARYLTQTGVAGRWEIEPAEQLLAAGGQLLDGTTYAGLQREPLRLLLEIQRVHRDGVAGVDADSFGPGANQHAYLCLRAVAWHQRGEPQRAAVDLAAARRLQPALVGLPTHLLTMRAHRACDVSEELEVRRYALEVLDLDVPTRVSQLTALGNALFRHDRKDESVEVQQVALTLCEQHPDEVASSERRLLQRNQAVTLVDRSAPGDLEAAIRLWRNLLDDEPDPIRALEDRFALTKLLGDLTAMVAVGAHLANQPELRADRRTVVWNQVCVALHRLELHDLVGEAAIQALLAAPSPDHPNVRDAVINLRASRRPTSASRGDLEARIIEGAGTTLAAAERALRAEDPRPGPHDG